MNGLNLSSEQSALVNASLDQHIFLHGPAGAGKTTAGIHRLRRLVESGIPGGSILILAPQRALAAPYFREIQSLDFPASSQPDIVTLGGLSQRLIRLFWPMIAKQAGFSHPTKPHTFLTYETAQFFMHRIAQPLINSGYFEAVTLDQNRIYTQILDNLNKSAVVGFPVEEIGPRLLSAQSENPSQPRLYADAYECALQFRHYCLKNNLLDYSLQIDVFHNHLWRSILCQKYFFGHYQHLIFDNIEEDVPVTHDLVAEWLPNMQSSLLIFDNDAGFRSFLGADATSAWSLTKHVDRVVEFPQNRVAAPDLMDFSESLSLQIKHQKHKKLPATIGLRVEINHHRFLPQMVNWVAESVRSLVQDQRVPEEEIVILVPFLSDTLDFYLSNQFEQIGIACSSRRPSRSLQDAPFIRCLLTLAKLAHPHWNMPVSLLELRSAFLQLFRGVDLVRIDLLCRIVYRTQKNSYFSIFQEIRPEIQKRLTPLLGEQYTHFLDWLGIYQSAPSEELEGFISRLFSELLIQPGFNFEADYDAVNQVSRLIESIQKFQLAFFSVKSDNATPPGVEYIHSVELGLISAQYITEWVNRQQNAVEIAPAFTFLMENRPAAYQFWLDIGSPGWWERLYQPLTHPAVLSRHWQPGRIWGDADEMLYTEAQLSRITRGLSLRCRNKIFMSYLMLDERGGEQRGMFLSALRRLFKSSSPRSSADV